MKAQNDYLDAVDRNDFVRIREIQAKYSGRTPLITTRPVTGMTIVNSLTKRFPNFIIYNLILQTKVPHRLRRHQSDCLMTPNPYSRPHVRESERRCRQVV